MLKVRTYSNRKTNPNFSSCLLFMLTTVLVWALHTQQHTDSGQLGSQADHLVSLPCGMTGVCQHAQLLFKILSRNYISVLLNGFSCCFLVSPLLREHKLKRICSLCQKETTSWVPQCMPVILVAQEARQEGWKFEVSLGSSARFCLKVQRRRRDE